MGAIKSAGFARPALIIIVIVLLIVILILILIVLLIDVAGTGQAQALGQSSVIDAPYCPCSS
jgi:hypothetical protein